MGLFGNNNNDLVHLAKEMAHGANEANKEIGELLAEFEEEQDQFGDVTENLISLSQRLLEKLSPSEAEELADATESVVRLYESYLSKYTKANGLSMNQIKRTQTAVDKYRDISS